MWPSSDDLSTQPTIAMPEIIRRHIAQRTQVPTVHSVEYEELAISILAADRHTHFCLECGRFFTFITGHELLAHHDGRPGPFNLTEFFPHGSPGDTRFEQWVQDALPEDRQNIYEYWIDEYGWERALVGLMTTAEFALWENYRASVLAFAIDSFMKQVNALDPAHRYILDTEVAHD